MWLIKNTPYTCCGPFLLNFRTQNLQNKKQSASINKHNQLGTNKCGNHLFRH